jgi:REP element-mobilizing transposase RayT
MKQRAFEFRRWGGRREGAGRERVLPGKPRLAHRTRERIPARLPVHVTLRMERGLPSLRRNGAFAAVAASLQAAQGKFGMQVTHFAVESNHVHLIVEGVSAAAMKGLGVRIARAVNASWRRSGRVIGDTYHARALRTPTEVHHAVRYVLNNHRKHTGVDAPDPFSSQAQPQVVLAPRTYLLRHWRSWGRGSPRRRG